MGYLKLAGLSIAAALVLGLGSGAKATPLSSSSAGVAACEVSDGLVIKALTRAGVAHRSARRTARRVNRRHGY